MAVRPRKKRKDRPLLKSEFDRFVKTQFAPLVQDVAGLKTDVAGLKTDVAGLKTDVAGLRADLSLVKRDLLDLSAIMQKKFGEVLTAMDEMVSLYKGSHDKLIVHDVRIAELETRVTALEMS